MSSDTAFCRNPVLKKHVYSYSLHFLARSYYLSMILITTLTKGILAITSNIWIYNTWIRPVNKMTSLKCTARQKHIKESCS